MRGLRSDVVQSSGARRGLKLLQEIVVPTQLPEGIEQSRVAPCASFDELPEVSGGDGASDLSHGAEADVEIVFREQRLARGDVLDRVGRAHRAEAAALAEFRGAPRPIGEEHAPVARVLRIRGRVEEVASEEHRQGEDERMPGAEQVHRLRRIEAPLRREDDANEIPEPVRLEQGDDAADRADRDVQGGHLARTPLPLVLMEPPLDRPDEGHVPAGRDRFPGMIVARFREHVEHCAEVRADRPLERDDVRVRHVDIAVDMGLESAGVRHDRSGEIQERVDALTHDVVPLRALPEDVGIRDQDLRTEPRREFRRRNDRAIRVHDGQERRRRHATVARIQRPEAGESVAVPHLEHARPWDRFEYVLFRGSATSPQGISRRGQLVFPGCSRKRSSTSPASAIGRKSVCGGPASVDGTMSCPAECRRGSDRASGSESRRSSRDRWRRCTEAAIAISRGPCRPGSIGGPGRTSETMSRSWTSRRRGSPSAAMR